MVEITTGYDRSKAVISPDDWISFPDQIALFRSRLMAWGRGNFRPFPWRESADPYHVLMAEVMLHRTQALQVVPVFQAFLSRFPDVATLAQADTEALHQILYPLGLRWRIDLIHTMGLELMTSFGGRIPREKPDLLTLPGVSDYIASAVRCFAWNLAEPLVDTNIVRVLSRIFGLEVKDSARRNGRFRRLVALLVDPESPRAYNYALLDLAHTICLKKRPPECLVCPVKERCSYRINISID